MYLRFYFSRFTVTSWRRICICFSPFSDLQSLLDAKNVSAFLLFAICSHFSPPEVYPIFSFWQSAVTFHHQKCILFSPFLDLQSLWKPGSVSFFLFLAICGHFGNPGVYLFFSFWRFAVTLVFMSVSAFYFFAICGHFWYLGLYPIFSF